MKRKNRAPSEHQVAWDKMVRKLKQLGVEDMTDKTSEPIDVKTTRWYTRFTTEVKNADN